MKHGDISICPLLRGIVEEYYIVAWVYKKSHFCYLHKDLVWRDSTISPIIDSAFWRHKKDAEKIVRNYEHREKLGENTIQKILEELT